MHRRQFLSCGVQFRFHVVHLGRWRKAWNKLDRHAAHNTFALVVMAQLRAQERRDGPTRLASKTALTRMQYRYSYHRNAVLQVFPLMTWIIDLLPDRRSANVQP